jgi:hypothetical protein
MQKGTPLNAARIAVSNRRILIGGFSLMPDAVTLTCNIAHYLNSGD